MMVAGCERPGAVIGGGQVTMATDDLIRSQKRDGCSFGHIAARFRSQGCNLPPDVQGNLIGLASGSFVCCLGLGFRIFMTRSPNGFSLTLRARSAPRTATSAPATAAEPAAEAGTATTASAPAPQQTKEPGQGGTSSPRPTTCKVGKVQFLILWDDCTNLDVLVRQMTSRTWVGGAQMYSALRTLQ